MENKNKSRILVRNNKLNLEGSVGK